MASSFLKFGRKLHPSKHDYEFDEERRQKELHTYKPFRIIGFIAAISAAGFSIYALVNDLWMSMSSEQQEWQSAVIGLLLFSLAFGFLAFVLTTCGLCTTSLPKKVYYYHSSGEIYFVCGVCSTAALAAYPAVMETKEGVPIHEFGIGYYLAWGMPLCYFIAAFCMTLDDMIHSAAKDCCFRCRKKSRYTSKSNHV